MQTINGNDVSSPIETTIVDLFDGWAMKAPNRVAAEWQGETLTYAGLRNASLHVSQALLSAGVRPRAKVPLLTEMSLEMLPAVIGILRVGACYVPMDVVAWGRSRIEAALSELASPVAIATSQCPGLQLPVITVNFQKEWLHSPLVKADDLYTQLDALRSGLRTDDLAWIIFTSGTTGKPKGVMVYHRAIYAVSVVKHSDDLEATGENGGRCLLAFSIAFDGCAAVVWTTLTKGGTLVMASSSNFPEVAASCDLLNLTPSMLAILDPSGPYDSARYIFLGAEAPSLEVVRQWIRPNRKVFTTYGPSETTCVISFGELNAEEEPHFGDLIPGVQVVLVNEHLQEADYGEVLIAGPGLAAGYLNNPELTAKKFIRWNGKRFYRTGDLARRTGNGGLVWGGRVDSLVKNRGFLINLETEVEPALLSFAPVQLAVAFKWRDKLVGCVQPATVDTEELRVFMKNNFDPFVVPDEILALDSFPLNVNSKTDRRALEAQLEERVSQHDETDLLDTNEISAYNALRLAFSKCLHIALKELGKDSSFTSLGGNSLTAIRLSNHLRMNGYLISVIQILKLDTIGQLEENVKCLSNLDTSQQGSNDWGSNSDNIPAPNVQRLFLTRSLQAPKQYALIGISKYIGDPHTVPTASELHDACIKALSAHSIFQTRFDLTNLSISDLGRLNLHWDEVNVAEEEFENACLAAEEKAWSDLNEITRADNEVPYCYVTCVSVPNRKALAFITRIHHVLIDVFSSAIISRDVERALAGEEIPQGPRFQDFARFMDKYQRDNKQRLIQCFENMVKPLPATAVPLLPSPRTPPPPQAIDMVRLDSPISISKAALDESARNHRVTTSTVVYAAWSLFLSKITGFNHVGFSIGLSGRTVPWPSAQSVVGPLLCRAPYCTAVPAQVTVHEWLAEVHQTTLDVLEFDGLPQGLPDSLLADQRTNTTIVLCFLDFPQPSANWSYRDNQKHSYLMSWHIFQHGEGLKTDFEIPSEQVDLDWAKEVAGIPGQMLERLVNATKDTLVQDLLG
ncbi:nonribosomal peptide synthase [Penicillium fimorum]|uniref:Nonribosomal peptide synthase n=1 Tax=Penicillium fimorum TaxID=1882269 RepID=A0A9W9XP74_9EURO|nr:nonribosomal peptide synthase [Penicillium fimorum]